MKVKEQQAIDLAERLRKRFASSGLVSTADIMKFVPLFLVAMEEMQAMKERAS